MKVCFVYILLLVQSIAFGQDSGNQSAGNGNYSLDKLNNYCDELINFRDNKLAKEFNSAYNTYLLNLDAKQDLAILRSDLLNDKASWYQILSTGAASSDYTLLFAEFCNAWKLIADKYLAILKMLSLNKGEDIGLGYGSSDQQYWYNLINAGRSIQKAVMENAEKEAYKAALSKSKETKALSNAINAALDFSGNLDNFLKLEKDHTQLKSEIKRMLALIDEKYAEYENSIKSSGDTQNEISKIVAAIDKYLLENCKQKDVIDDQLQKELAKGKAQPTDTSGNSFFIFLTAVINTPPDNSQFSALQTPVSVHIISAAIWYTRNQTDENSIKEQFIQEVEKQVSKLPENFRKTYSANNYGGIGFINTNLKESVPLLTNDQCLDAIKNYESLILNIDRSAKFIKLK